MAISNCLDKANANSVLKTTIYNLDHYPTFEERYEK